MVKACILLNRFLLCDWLILFTGSDSSVEHVHSDWLEKLFASDWLMDLGESDCDGDACEVLATMVGFNEVAEKPVLLSLILMSLQSVKQEVGSLHRRVAVRLKSAKVQDFCNRKWGLKL